MTQVKQFRILIVDDSLENIQRLGTVMRQQDYLVNVARSGGDALEAVTRVLPDLILLDVTMPGMDGYETCAQLRTSPSTSGVPIIFITGKTEAEDIAKGFEVGAVDYVTKPFNNTEIVARVATHLSRYHMERELESRVAELAEELDRSEKLQQKIARLQKEQYVFLTHELKNHLTPIMGYADLLTLGKGNLGDKETQWVNRIRDATDVMVDVINSLRHLNEIEAGTYRLEKVPVDVDALLTDACNGMITAFGETAVLDYRNTSKVKKIEVDPSLMAGVFSNLLKNAIEHVSDLEPSEARTVTVLVFDRIGSVVFSIQNGGKPIPQERLPAFFEKFNTSKPSGTGIGTTYAYMVAKSHGGDIEVQSDSTDGTVLTVSIPVYQGD